MFLRVQIKLGVLTRVWSRAKLSVLHQGLLEKTTRTLVEATRDYVNVSVASFLLLVFCV